MTLVSSCSAESDLLAREVTAAGESLGAMEFSGIFVPGLNRQLWRAGKTSRLISFFQTSEIRSLGESARFLPLCYQDILKFYLSEHPQAALFMCAPPDADGNCSFGTEVSFIAALWPNIPIRIAHINPSMPRTAGDPGIPFAQITAYFEEDQALRSLPACRPNDRNAIIANHVATMVPNGATLQTGLGKLPDAVLVALRNHRDLRLHSGLIGDGALALVESGAMAPGPSALVGVAIGSEALYSKLDNDTFQFRPVTVTHDHAMLAGIEQLVTINSANAVDLFGQVYAEATSRGFQSGPGGASDYARGARASANGLRVVALPATAGPTSRIVAAGAGPGPVSLSRFDVDVFVTEYGIADLRGLDHNDRANALIAIAAPDHRDELQRSWEFVVDSL